MDNAYHGLGLDLDDFDDGLPKPGVAAVLIGCALEAVLVAVTIWGLRTESSTWLGVDCVVGAATVAMMPLLWFRPIPTGFALAALAAVSAAATPIASLAARLHLQPPGHDLGGYSAGPRSADTGLNTNMTEKVQIGNQIYREPPERVRTDKGAPSYPAAACCPGAVDLM